MVTAVRKWLFFPVLRLLSVTVFRVVLVRLRNPLAAFLCCFACILALVFRRFGPERFYALLWFLFLRLDFLVYMLVPGSGSCPALLVVLGLFIAGHLLGHVFDLGRLIFSPRRGSLPDVGLSSRLPFPSRSRGLLASFCLLGWPRFSTPVPVV